MKVLYFIDSLHSGGKERRLVELIKGLSDNNEIEMEIVLTKENVHYEEIFSTGIKIHYALRNFKKDLSPFYRFYKIAKNFSPDIIHVWSNLVAYYAIPAKVMLRIPMINNQITNAKVSNGNRFLGHKFPFLFSDRIISNTMAGLDAYRPPDEKSRVIYNGFDFKRIENLEDSKLVRKRFGITTDKVIAMVASFNEKKDYKCYLEAAKILLEDDEEITFLCIGAGNFEPYMELVGEQYKTRILFLGRQANVESIMSICKIGVLVTRFSHAEGISNALLEFCALGIPVVASDSGGNKEIVKNGESGYLIPLSSSMDLANRIQDIINDDHKQIVLGQNARRIVTEKFTIGKMIDSFLDEYTKICS